MGWLPMPGRKSSGPFVKVIMPHVFRTKEARTKLNGLTKHFKKTCKDVGIGIRFFHNFRRTARIAVKKWLGVEFLKELQ